MCVLGGRWFSYNLGVGKIPQSRVLWQPRYSSSAKDAWLHSTTPIQSDLRGWFHPVASITKIDLEVET